MCKNMLIIWEIYCDSYCPLSAKLTCGLLDSPSNGRVNTSAGTSFGDVARYSCDTGYTLNGPAERTCQADRQWNGSVPTCEHEILGACSDEIYFLCM